MHDQLMSSSSSEVLRPLPAVHELEAQPIRIPYSGSADSLRWAMRLSIMGTELQHAIVQARLLSILLAGALVFDLVDPALLILAVDGSMLHRVAMLTQHASAIGISFACLALGLVPYLVLQLLWPGSRWRRAVTKASCLVLVLGGLQWIFLAWTARHVDYEVVGGIFLRTGIGAMLFAAALALSLNSEQARQLLESP